MENFIFLYVAALLLAGLFSTRLMKVFRLPNVTGYIITGIIMGPFVLGLFFNGFDFMGANNPLTSPIYSFVKRLGWVNNIALGFIAFSIGSSFKASALKRVGKKVIWITIFESLMASIVVLIGLGIAHIFNPEAISWPLILSLAAIAAATAPAATLMVVKQYKAHGPVVDTLLPTVALDDASALILFAVLFQIARSIATGDSFSVWTMLGKPLCEIGLSLLIGAALGFFISWMCAFFKSRTNRLIWAVFVVFASVGIYFLFRQDYMGKFELSSLLTCMAAGAIFTNFNEDSYKTFEFMDRFTAPIYMIFFIISGASLDLTVFTGENGLIVIIIALVYIFSRAAGKWSGAFTGALITKAEPTVKKYLGFALIPQAGVAIGLATSSAAIFGEHEATAQIGALIVAVILTSTLVYELVGPFVTKIALEKAGEIERIERQEATSSN